MTLQFTDRPAADRPTAHPSAGVGSAGHPQPLVVDFAGEIFAVEPGEVFTVGREGSLALDDNPYLHRQLLVVDRSAGFWWIANVGQHIAVEVADTLGRSRSTVGPGARLPLVFPRAYVTFTAGPTSYELELAQEALEVVHLAPRDADGGDTTVGPTEFTRSQLAAVLALAEPLLRRPGSGSWTVRSAVEAADRLGWTQTRFNRKLDNVCDKLDRAGVGGLKGGSSGSAANRRIRLVEYALDSRLVSLDHLGLLEAEIAEARRGAR